MVDNFAFMLTHGLLLLAAFRLLWRDDLDDEKAASVEEQRTTKVAAGSTMRSEQAGVKSLTGRAPRG